MAVLARHARQRPVLWPEKAIRIGPANDAVVAPRRLAVAAEQFVGLVMNENVRAAVTPRRVLVASHCRRAVENAFHAGIIA